jgi:ribosomal protein L11 methyltransferase
MFTVGGITIGRAGEGAMITVAPPDLSDPATYGSFPTGIGWEPGTREMIAHLATMNLTGKTVADVGCGAGILSLVAARQGARKVYALDIDPDCIALTTANAARNGRTLVTTLGSLPPETVDYIVCNMGGSPWFLDNLAAMRAKSRNGVLGSLDTSDTLALALKIRNRALLQAVTPVNTSRDGWAVAWL